MLLMFDLDELELLDGEEPEEQGDGLELLDKETLLEMFRKVRDQAQEQYPPYTTMPNIKWYDDGMWKPIGTGPSGPTTTGTPWYTGTHTHTATGPYWSTTCGGGTGIANHDNYYSPTLTANTLTAINTLHTSVS